MQFAKSLVGLEGTYIAKIFLGQAKIAFISSGTSAFQRRKGKRLRGKKHEGIRWAKADSWMCGYSPPR